MRSKNRKTPWIHKLDKIVREMVFFRDNYTCVKCGRTRPYQLHPSHVITRANKKLRWDLNNLKTLCAHCHMAWHNDPVESAEWFKKTFPDRYEYLQAHRNELGKYSVEDLKEMYEGFKQVCVQTGVL